VLDSLSIVPHLLKSSKNNGGITKQIINDMRTICYQIDLIGVRNLFQEDFQFTLP